MTDKEKYRLFCASELSIPIYSRDWWLDCVCGDANWDVLLFRNGELVEAAMPYYSPCKGIVLMPAYTQTLGIWFNPALKGKKYLKDLYRKQQICSCLIERLPENRYFLQNFHYSFTDWLPFYWKDYAQTTRYTYVLPDIRNIDKVKKNLGHSITESLRRAGNKYQLKVVRNLSIDRFMEINAQVFERQNQKAYQPERLKKLIQTAMERKQGDIWGAFDADGRLHAAVFAVWQESCAYAIAGGNCTELRYSGGYALAFWQAICDLSEVSTAFDFEGSMIKGIEFFFREFGAIQMPFFVISKGNLNFEKKIRLKIKQWF